MILISHESKLSFTIMIYEWRIRSSLIDKKIQIQVGELVAQHFAVNKIKLNGKWKKKDKRDHGAVNCVTQTSVHIIPSLSATRTVDESRQTDRYRRLNPRRRPTVSCMCVIFWKWCWPNASCNPALHGTSRKAVGSLNTQMMWPRLRNIRKMFVPTVSTTRIREKCTSSSITLDKCVTHLAWLIQPIRHFRQGRLKHYFPSG